MLDPKLLEILACPLCDSRPPLEERGEMLVCTQCGHGFRIVNGIPHMLPEDAVAPSEVSR